MSSSSFRRFFSSEPSQPRNNNAGNQQLTLTLRASPHDYQTTIIERLDPYGNTIPVFTFTKTYTKPHAFFSRLVPGPQQPRPVVIANATLKSLTSSVELSLHGQYVKMKPNQLTGDGWKFVYPPLGTGKFKWESENIFGSVMALYDESGTKLARYKVLKKFEILVPCNDHFLDMAVVSGLGASMMAQKDLKTAADGVAAIADAGGS